MKTKTIVRASPYTMTVDLNVIDHLGLNLYSNISAVLTEAVANAWDADAHVVKIDVDVEKGHDTVRIADDGIGMSVEDVNKKYLHVGYRRRDAETDTTPLGRPVMGRKGLGKLSLFSLADIVEVQSAKGRTRHGLIMDVAAMRRVCKNHVKQYHPTPLPRHKVHVTKGTTITLHKIKRPRLAQSIDALRMQLARRFSVIGEHWGFMVVLNGTPISIEDRCELKAAQFLWTIGDFQVEPPRGHHIKQFFKIPSDGNPMGPQGWIATANEPGDLKAYDANLNNIVVLSRGRLIQEDIFSKFHDGRMYTKYITGQINYDLLDDTKAGEDVATSDRQRIQEDDPRYLHLLDFLKKVLSRVEADWKEFRPRHQIEAVKERYPAVIEWMDTLKPGTKKNAEKMVAKVVALPIDYEEDRKTLLKHSIYAFERMELRGSEAEFVNGLGDLKSLLGLLANRDSYEAALYHDIVRSRIEAIRQIQDLVDENKKEKVLQQYLFDHLWLLDTSWERASGCPARMEESLKREFKAVGDVLAPDERKGRLDIRYKTSAGAHIIVELKRYKRVVTLSELIKQGEKYKSALATCLEKCGTPSPNIQIVFVLGQMVKQSANRMLGGAEYVEQSLANLNARVVYYDQMIVNAQNAYGEYIEKDKQLNRLDEVIAKL